MRTIKFRGKRLDGFGWITGNLITKGDERFIIPYEFKGRYDKWTNWVEAQAFMVIPESVGQRTGIKNVYEGDITKSVDSNWGYGGEYDRTHDGYLYQVVEFRDGAFYIGDNLLADCSDYEIVGNIHGNPELMEVE